MIFREEAIRDIVKFGMTFKRSALFMIRKKYPDLDFSDINFTDMRGHNIPDPSEPVQAVSVQPVEDGGIQTNEVEGVETEEAQAEATCKTLEFMKFDMVSKIKV